MSSKIIHQIAHCLDCGKTWEGFEKGQKLIYDLLLKYGKIKPKQRRLSL